MMTIARKLDNQMHPDKHDRDTIQYAREWFECLNGTLKPIVQRMAREHPLKVSAFWRRVEVGVQDKHRLLLACHRFLSLGGIRSMSSCFGFAHQVLEWMATTNKDADHADHHTAAALDELKQARTHLSQFESGERSRMKAEIANLDSALQASHLIDWAVAVHKAVCWWLGALLACDVPGWSRCLSSLNLNQLREQFASSMTMTITIAADTASSHVLNKRERDIYETCMLEFSRSPSDYFWAHCWTLEAFNRCLSLSRHHTPRLDDVCDADFGFDLKQISRLAEEQSFHSWIPNPTADLLSMENAFESSCLAYVRDTVSSAIGRAVITKKRKDPGDTLEDGPIWKRAIKVEDEDPNRKAFEPRTRVTLLDAVEEKHAEEWPLKGVRYFITPARRGDNDTSVEINCAILSQLASLCRQRQKSWITLEQALELPDARFELEAFVVCRRAVKSLEAHFAVHTIQTLASRLHAFCERHSEPISTFVKSGEDDGPVLAVQRQGKSTGLRWFPSAVVANHETGV